jgi:broad specificity phosphatase PhoE
MIDNENIVLIRHAQSIANAGNRTTNIESISLTTLGFEQSERISLNFVPDLVVVSPYIRTTLTAQPLLKNLGISNVQIWDEAKEFTYLSKTKYLNTTEKEREPGARAFWESKDPNYRDDEESFNDLIIRADKFLSKLEKCGYNKVVVFTHQQFLIILRMILLYKNKSPLELMDMFWEERNNFPIGNTDKFTFKKLMAC